MTIYIDQISKYENDSIEVNALRYGNKWCHLVTDGDIDELHEFAQSIGLLRSWFQDHSWWPHYDLTYNKRSLAIVHGATEVESLAMLARKIGKEVTIDN